MSQLRTPTKTLHQRLTLEPRENLTLKLPSGGARDIYFVERRLDDPRHFLMKIDQDSLRTNIDVIV
jgi:hypothetical protein